jgi:hypothetical protein
MIPQQDVTVLRDLGKRIAELAAEESNQEKIRNWTRMNDLDTSVKPQVLTHLWPLAWNEILPDSEMVCTDERARRYERYMRERIWMTENLEDDGVIEPIIYWWRSAWIDPYEGLVVEKRWADGDTDHSGAAEFIPVIVEKTDIEKIGDPVLHVDEEADARAGEEAHELFDGILTVVRQPYYFAAKVADEFSWLRGLENTYMDIIEDPDWAHEALQRIADNFVKRFKLMEQAGVWGVPVKSDPLGSAGLRFVSGVPDWSTADDPATFAPKLAESWGFTCAEVYNCVSPVMHDEFGFEYDRQMMSMFKCINVGCCETLDTKVKQVRSLPNARKISVSEWCDVGLAAQELGADYVYSYRAAGVPFIQDPWDVQNVRDEIGKVLEVTKGMPVEIVLNIGGTLGEGDPAQKLIEWTRTVRDLIQ